MPLSRQRPDCLEPPKGVLMSISRPFMVMLPERTRRDGIAALGILRVDRAVQAVDRRIGHAHTGSPGDSVSNMI